MSDSPAFGSGKGQRRRGIYDKYEVRRRDGRDGPGRDREDQVIFVLDIRHDPYARQAAALYAAAASQEYPELSADLRKLLREVCE